MRNSLVILAALAACSCAPAGRHSLKPPQSAALPAIRRRTPKQSAERMIAASRTTLAPVYAPLAEQLVRDLGLAGRAGVGIDLGSGPGNLIVELCKHTQLHWVNADINPHFFPHFLRLAEVNGVGHRVSAVLADAQSLPFRDGYADVIVSRGSYHFWPDRRKGFAEVHRVLKPGGVAYIGRGFSRNLPLAIARQVRAKQRKSWRYDRVAEGQALRKLLVEMRIPNVRIHLPNPPGGADVNYGVWVEFRKPTVSAP